jgi:hypothetical protein
LCSVRYFLVFLELIGPARSKHRLAQGFADFLDIGDGCNAGGVDHFGSYIAYSPIGDNFPGNSFLAAYNVNARLIQIEPYK